VHHRPHSSPAERRPWTILVLAAVAQFMVVLDVTVVNVALPSIARDLDFSPGGLQWAVTAYVLVTGGLLILGGRAADALGRRRMFLAGLAVFTTASLASGLAASPTLLIAARAVQGLGAALMSPAALSIVTTSYSGGQRTAALSIWGAIGAGGAAAGVLFGGMLTAWLSWRWVFFINVPIGVITGLLALHLVPRAAGAPRSLDVGGALALTGGLVVLVYALDGAASHGWGSARTVGLLGAAAALLATFALVERRVARPLIAPPTWRVRSLVSSAAMMLGATAILVGTFFLNSLYLQDVLDASALETGLAFLPLTLIIGAGAHLAPHALTRHGARGVVVAGLALMGGGSLLLALAPGEASYATDLLPGYLALGFGAGLVFPAVSITAMTDVNHDDAGMASGLMQTSHEIGAALGVAILSAVATAAGATPALGFQDGSVAAAVIAAALAVLALVSVPAIRPLSSARAFAH
jgi:EmrB/QacA subfamily drug resistance transporter